MPRLAGAIQIPGTKRRLSSPMRGKVARSYDDPTKNRLAREAQAATLTLEWAYTALSRLEQPMSRKVAGMLLGQMVVLIADITDKEPDDVT